MQKRSNLVDLPTGQPGPSSLLCRHECFFQSASCRRQQEVPPRKGRRRGRGRRKKRGDLAQTSGSRRLLRTQDVDKASTREDVPSPCPKLHSHPGPRAPGSPKHIHRQCPPSLPSPRCSLSEGPFTHCSVTYWDSTAYSSCLALPGHALLPAFL